MCGICGVVRSSELPPIDESRLVAMRDALAHRGPDDAGRYLGPGAALGSRRLAVLDLSAAGHMPMSTPDGRYVLIYNGEIYNFVELRRDLEARGRVFRSHTDTEVLLHGYAEYGAALLPKLNGMFAFAVWDTHEKSLFLARDRFGVKPLVYSIHQHALYFASEEKALFTAGVPAEFDPTLWDELLCLRYTAGERTPFRNVSRLLPGHTLTWKDGRVQTQPWYRLEERIAELRESVPADAAAWFRSLFDDAVALRRVSDVPVGVLLSGGFDSTSVAASLARSRTQPYAGFTVSFSEAGFDESLAARHLAEQYGLSFHPLTMTAEQVVERMEQALWYNDEPLAHGNEIHIWAVAQHAKPLVTVLLSGEGADETNGGYVRYRPLHYPKLLTAFGWAAPWLNRSGLLRGRWRKLARLTAQGSLDEAIVCNGCDVFPHELAQLGPVPTESFAAYPRSMLAAARRLYPREPLRQAMYVDLHGFLPSLLNRVDRMTMAASIECREPFLDYRLVEGLGALPTRVLFERPEPKYLARVALGSRLPSEIMTGRKWGFGVPWNRYLREVPALREQVQTLPTTEPIASGPFRPAAIRDIVDRFLAGDSSSLMLVRQLLMVAVWHRSYFGRLRALPHAA